MIARIPNMPMVDPVADRERLALAAERHLRQGLGVGDARALLSGTERLRRPFPALMWRLRDMRAARGFLDGALGRGIHGSGLPVPTWPVLGEDDPFARPEQFLLDSRGRAAGTCPRHPAVRNVPAGRGGGRPGPGGVGADGCLHERCWPPPPRSRFRGGGPWSSPGSVSAPHAGAFADWARELIRDRPG